MGADSAIGTRFAARDDARVIDMFGSGGMARAERHGIEMVTVTGEEEVYRGADIVCACTDAAADVVGGDLLAPGTHVTAIGGRPDARARQRFDVWLRLGTAPAPVSTPSGDRRVSTSFTGRRRTPRFGRPITTTG